MKVTAENIDNCQVVLNIEAEVDEVDKSLDEAYKKLVKKVSIPGFRKGKAPRDIMEQHIGKLALLDEALESLVPQLYKQAIESQKLEPIASPQLEITQMEPVTIKAVVPLKPEVKLGDYSSIKLETEVVKVSKKEITDAMEQIREEQGAWIPVDRPVELDDLITMDIVAHVEDKKWLDHKGIAYEVDKDSLSPVAGFALQLQGFEKNQEKQFSMTIPDDHQMEGFRGKECNFEVTVTELKEKQLPELDDELASNAGYASLADMKKKVTANLKDRAEAKSRSELGQKAIDALVEMSEVNYPPVFEEEEIDGLLREQAQRFGFKELADFIKRTNRTEEELKQELSPIARKRLSQGLTLEKLTEVEKIEVDTSEVDNRIDEIVNSSDDQTQAKQFLSLDQVRQSLERSLLTEKTIDRLVKLATSSDENTTKEE